MLSEQLSIRLLVQQRIITSAGHTPCSGFHSRSRMSDRNWDRSSRLLQHESVPLMILVGLPRIPSYHSLPATLGGARAGTPQAPTPLQAHLLVVTRLRAVLMSGLSQQAPLPEEKPTDFAVSTSAFQSSLGMNPRRKSGLNSASRSSS